LFLLLLCVGTGAVRGVESPETALEFETEGVVVVRFEGIQLVADVISLLRVRGALVLEDGEHLHVDAEGPLRGEAGRASPLATSEAWAAFDLVGVDEAGAAMRIVGGLIAHRDGASFDGGLAARGIGSYAMTVRTSSRLLWVVGTLAGEGRGRLVAADEPGTLQLAAMAYGLFEPQEATTIEAQGEEPLAEILGRFPFDLNAWPASLAVELLVWLESCLRGAGAGEAESGV
jgi:hypothetical protein